MKSIHIALIICVCLMLFIIYVNSDFFNLKCVIATKDGKTYCVRDTPNLKKSANLLATVSNRMNKLVQYTYSKYPNQEDVQRLYQNFNPNKIVETLPTSEYTAYSENKGQKLALCLRKNKEQYKLIDINTLTFVAIHELSHLMTKSIGHGDEFWNHFKFLLKCAVEIGIYNPVDYSNEPQSYCGMEIDDNPYYDN
jgi:WLM domain